MSLTITLAARGRPERLIDTIERTIPNIALDSTRLLVNIDADDQPTVDALAAWGRAAQRSRVIVSAEPRPGTIAEKWNRALTVAPADAYLVMVDYAPHVTPGFDAKIIEAASLFPDNIGVVYSHMANASFPIATTVTHRLAELMGFIYPPYFPYWFVDHWVDDIARLLGRISFADIALDIGVKPNTQELREPGFWATVFDTAVVERRHCAHKIIRSHEFLEAPWRKEILLRHHPLVEYRSRWANSILHQNSAVWHKLSNAKPDERYERIKANAMRLMGEWIPALEAEWAKAA